MAKGTAAAKRSDVIPDGSDRSAYIGGSDAASIIGVSPWGSAYRTWAKKICADDEDNRADMLSLKPWIQWGNILEPVVAEQFSIRMGMKVVVEPRFLVHPKYRFMGGHIDRRIVSKTRRSFLECKTSNAFDYRDWGEEEAGVDGVPLHYVAQCDHYMLCDDFDDCYLAVLIGGSDMRIYHIERSAERERVLLDAERAFWKLVLTDKPPPIRSEQDAKHRWRESLVGTAIPVDKQVKELVSTLSVITEKRKEIDKQEKALRDQLFPLFKDKEALSFEGDLIAQLTCYSRNDFDQKAFELKHPKIASKFMRKLPTKRLKLLV